MCLSKLSDNFQTLREFNDLAFLKLAIDGESFLKVSFTHIQVEENETSPQSPLQNTMKLMASQASKTTLVKQ